MYNETDLNWPVENCIIIIFHWDNWFLRLPEYLYYNDMHRFIWRLKTMAAVAQDFQYLNKTIEASRTFMNWKMAQSKN